MRKLLAIVTVFLMTQQFINAAPIFEEYHTDILEINGRTAVIKDSDDIVIGSSGIVTHTFEQGTSSIVARVDVIKKDGDKATIRFDIYKLSTQGAFPKPGVLPEIGDKVTLNFLYERALIVAPNYDVYKEVTTHFKDMQWVHPDLVAMYLAKEYRPNPDREIFQSVCALNSTSLIFFALDNSGYFVDCNNFKTVKEIKTGQAKKVQVPFYTRISEINTHWLVWSGKDITNYNSYYRRLIGQ